VASAWQTVFILGAEVRRTDRRRGDPHPKDYTRLLNDVRKYEVISQL
jgi:hypothetical protein